MGVNNFMDELVHKIQSAIEQVVGQYFRLVILVGAPSSGKTAALQSVAHKLVCKILNVNLELSKKMLGLTRTQRARQAERLLQEVIASSSGDVVLLDNLEILFDTGLEIQPLRLLQVLNRNRTIVASWNGSFHGETLIYAEPGHPEFMQFKQPEAVVVTVGKSFNN